MYATTSDFRTFSAAQVWVDKGYSTIDSTLIRHDGTYYRYTKDERSSGSTPCSQFILAERSTTMLNRTYSFVAECIGRGTISRGEGPTIFKSNTGRALVPVHRRVRRPRLHPVRVDRTSPRARGPRCRATPCPAGPGTARSCPSRRRSTTGCSNGGADAAGGGPGRDRARPDAAGTARGAGQISHWRRGPQAVPGRQHRALDR